MDIKSENMAKKPAWFKTASIFAWILLGTAVFLNGWRVFSQLAQQGKSIGDLSIYDLSVYFVSILADTGTTPLTWIALILFFGQRDVNSMRSIAEKTQMKEKIKKDRNLLILFFFSWLALKSVLLRTPQEASLTYTVIGLTGLSFLILAAIYVYKMYKLYNPRKALALATTYFVFDFILPLVSIVIGAVTIWKSREMLIQEQKLND